MTDDRYQFEKARAYWRHAPSGSGKHDTATLATASDGELLAVWDEAFRSRLRGYPEEELFVREFARSVAGQRILSIGSGLGLHEIYYQAAGARVTCADIVASNLRVTERVASRKGLPAVRTIVIGNEDLAVAGPCDILFIYGALMHMPRTQQRDLLRRAAELLAPGGRIILMLYTWTFVSSMCGWTSPQQFDPVAFGRASDPSVGAEDCPWSDWHDDRAVLDVAGEDFHIARKQLWNRAFFVWYELQRGPAVAVRPFFDRSAWDEGVVVSRIDGRQFHAGDATAGPRPGSFETGRNQMHYAALSPELQVAPAKKANALHAVIELESGCVSVALLDLEQQRFVATTVVTRPGIELVRLLVDHVPARCQIIVSNHHEAGAGVSRFVVGPMEFRAIQLAEPPVSPAVGG